MKKYLGLRTTSMAVSVRDKLSGLLSYIQLSYHTARLKQLEVQTLNDKTLKTCEPLLSQKIPKDVYNKEGNDLFAFLSILYLIVIDYTSKCFRLAQLLNTSSNTVITHMISIFAKHSIPKVIFSDNRPQYSSQSFKTFSKLWDFTQSSSIPKFLQSNRFLETAIRTITKP